MSFSHVNPAFRRPDSFAGQSRSIVTKLRLNPWQSGLAVPASRSISGDSSGRPGQALYRDETNRREHPAHKVKPITVCPGLGHGPTLELRPHEGRFFSSPRRTRSERSNWNDELRDR